MEYLLFMTLRASRLVLQEIGILKRIFSVLGALLESFRTESTQFGNTPHTREIACLTRLLLAKVMH